MAEFTHERHKPPRQLVRARELLLVCSPLRSNVNFSRIVRTASCCGLTRIVAAGHPRLDPEIARIGGDAIVIERHRSLPPVLAKLRQDGYQLVGLEQASGSVCLFEFTFARRTALVVGNERQGLADGVLAMLDVVAEIPVFGLPYSHNVATAAAMALYEYCRQYPDG
jgi:tRNA G18 (ribose-2'-O)-methylase SpoU